MVLSLSHIHKKFHQQSVLKDVSFDIESGRIFGFLGRNGAGKTTTIRILMDVFKPDKGAITLQDKPFIRSLESIGYLPEERGMYAKSLVKDQLIYFARLRGANKKAAEKTVQYWSEKFFIDPYLDRPLETLSKGNQQKVQITQAFLNDPDILILDEPFSGLDPVNATVFQETLLEKARENKIIIFSSHQMSYVEKFCDDICMIDQGEIVLKGALDTIKKKFGANKLRLSVNHMTLEALQAFLPLEFKDTAIEDDYLVITLPPSMDKKHFLSWMAKENLDIKLFADYTPSMANIFIDQVATDKQIDLENFPSTTEKGENH